MSLGLLVVTTARPRCEIDRRRVVLLRNILDGGERAVER
jgi:hypothetical protein